MASLSNRIIPRALSIMAIAGLVAFTVPASDAVSETKNAPKIYFVYGSLSSEGGVKVVGADGLNETLLAIGGEIVEPDGIEVDLSDGPAILAELGYSGFQSDRDYQFSLRRRPE